nr:MAG TPA: hypothetical protein [Bacteriophage sp.]
MTNVLSYASPSLRGRGLKFSAMSDATVTAILFKSKA